MSTAWSTFDERRWTTLFETWEAWWNHSLDRPVVIYEGYLPGYRETHPQAPPQPSRFFLGDFPLDTPPEQLLQKFEEHLQAAFFVGDAFPRFWINLGPGVLAAALGAQFEFFEGSLWFQPSVSEETPLSEVRLEFNPDQVLWRKALQIAHQAVERWGSRVAIGVTDLGGNLDILASLIGPQRLAMELIDHPLEVERLCAEIRSFWLQAYCDLAQLCASNHRGYTCWGPLYSSLPHYMLQSDFSYMISPAHFRRFVVPDLIRCSQEIPNAFYHLDGKGQIRHLDELLKIESIRGIQWIPGAGEAPPQEWLPLLQRIREANKLCQVYVSSEGALRITRELGGKGFAFVLDDETSPEQAETIVKTLYEAG
ncbi:MAG: hypothetical protein RML93_05770 [Anaerolineales bacterium]|nr:hypothetical protein [Anaerolineales bacterium]MDW8446784.1 hypothetical protein [Anaerolineales bacterium]